MNQNVAGSHANDELSAQAVPQRATHQSDDAHQTPTKVEVDAEEMMMSGASAHAMVLMKMSPVAKGTQNELADGLHHLRVRLVDKHRPPGQLILVVEFRDHRHHNAAGHSLLLSFQAQTALMSY